MREQDESSPYQIFMLGLCAYVLMALGVQTAFPLLPETLKILDRVDTAICGFFLADFVRNLVLAPDRWRYLVTWGWLDLLSSIPAIDFLRWGRAARAFRILRVLRGLRASRLLGRFALERRAESAIWAALLVAILVIIFGSIGILHLESSPESNIRDADDALWWSLVTITTVGYGDTYPVTAPGRVLAAVVMAAGIGLVGTFTAYVAATFLAPDEAALERRIDLLQAEIRGLRDALLQKNPDR